MTTATMNRMNVNPTEQKNNTIFANIKNNIRLHFKRRRMLNELYDLDDRTLDDIGLNRGEIYSFVKNNCK